MEVGGAERNWYVISSAKPDLIVHAAVTIMSLPMSKRTIASWPAADAATGLIIKIQDNQPALHQQVKTLCATAFTDTAWSALVSAVSGSLIRCLPRANRRRAIVSELKPPGTPQEATSGRIT